MKFIKEFATYSKTHVLRTGTGTRSLGAIMRLFEHAQETYPDLQLDMVRVERLQTGGVSIEFEVKGVKETPEGWKEIYTTPRPR